MNMTKRQIITKTSVVGTHFFQHFPINEGVAIGSRFMVEEQEWIVGRIDNVVAGDTVLFVEGRAIPVNLESSH